MLDEVISYRELCRREGTRLRRGMNFGLGGAHSVILMSQRPDAPYADRVEQNGRTLIYDGHDEPRRLAALEPKHVDQPLTTSTGRPTQNARFLAAAAAYQRGDRPPERVRVYEKLRVGVWADRGMFLLVDAWTERDARRRVFKFKLMAGGDDDEP